MPIPTYDQLLRPVLEYGCTHNFNRKTAAAAMCQAFNLTPEEENARIKSGATYIGNRTGWAMSHLTKGSLIEKVANSTYRTTDKGRDYLAKHKGPITPADLRQIEGLVEAWEEASKKNALGKKSPKPGPIGPIGPVHLKTPEEQIETALGEVNESLASELLDHMAKMDPFLFEQLVVDLLSAMGYGGTWHEAAKVTQKSNDEGIDGIISQDRLGLDVIYVQAKRWQKSIGRGEIQSFVGALAGKQANKGVFITTSSFINNAAEYAATVSQKVILIDGPRLADLMIEHDIGVSTTRTIALKRIDTDYFEEN